MSDTQVQAAKEKTATAESAETRMDPRLPWEVSASGLRHRPEPVPSPGVSPAVFAGAGKLDILSKIGELRRELDHLYRDRDTLRSRGEELESMLADARTQIMEAKAQVAAGEQAKNEWKMERQELLEQVMSLRERLQRAEAERDSLDAQLEVSEASVAEIRDALNWRTAPEDPEPVRENG